VPLPAAPDPERDRYLPVAVSGVFDGEELRVLASSRDTGAAYRMISAFDTPDGRRIMVDRGLLPVETEENPLAGQGASVTGNLHWPDEVDSYTPPPDLDGNIWFARDVPAMATALGAEPVLIVAREHRRTRTCRPAPAGGHGPHPEQPPWLRRAVVRACSGLGGDDTFPALAYQAANGLKGA
jgi:surfeit locus 1 family protein